MTSATYIDVAGVDVVAMGIRVKWIQHNTRVIVCWEKEINSGGRYRPLLYPRHQQKTVFSGKLNT